MKRKSVSLAISLVVLLLFGTAGSVLASEVVGSTAGTTSNANVPWAYQMQNQQNTGFSPETRINAANVGTLAPAWSIPLNNLAGTPVVVKGIVYVAGPPFVYAVNEKTGALVWEDGPSTGLAPFSYRTAVGVAVSGGKVFEATDNNILVSLNAKTGALNWMANITSTLVGNLYPYEGAEAAPLVYNGMLIVGETQGDTGPTRGVVQAFSESNGAHLWTFYTVPPGPINSTNQAFYQSTWGTNGTAGCYCGGGAVWNVPAVDPTTGIIYFGTGNPYATNNPFVRQPSQADTNLYSESIIALNSKNGQLVWYHQETNPAYTDWDQGMPVQLFNVTIHHVKTEIVGVGGKAGIYFELNAATGAVIHDVPVGIHLNDDVPDTSVNSTGFTMYPGDDGGDNTFSSFSSNTNMIYTMALNDPSHCQATKALIKCSTDSVAPNSTLYAINAATGSVVWSTNLAGRAGGVSSADNLVFYSDGNHTFYAANAKTGAVLWQYNDPTGSAFLWSWGPPAIVDGLALWTTYGLSNTPGHLIAFSLGGTDSVEP
ncbi:MAG: PQQ-binding-like beta-propeller repeat protein [Thaumarchaeota archaeon]|nr:PQQ-binding-like beta-propeller repeat protein [Nitrososphaerota archaeon]